jgi:hypothetical protein
MSEPHFTNINVASFLSRVSPCMTGFFYDYEKPYSARSVLVTRDLPDIDPCEDIDCAANPIQAKSLCQSGDMYASSRLPTSRAPENHRDRPVAVILCKAPNLAQS